MKRTTTIRLALLLAVSFAVLASSPAVLCDINVPNEYPTIADAFAATSGGEAITLDDGVYWLPAAQGVSVEGITLRSVNGSAADCIIYYDSETAFYLSLVEAFNASGITFICNNTGASYPTIFADHYWDSSYDPIIFGIDNCAFIQYTPGDAIVLEFSGDTIESQNMQVPAYLVVNGSAFGNSSITFNASSLLDVPKAWGGIYVSYCDFTGSAGMVDQALQILWNFTVQVNNCSAAGSGDTFLINTTWANTNVTLAWNNLTANNVLDLETGDEVVMWGNVINGYAYIEYCDNLTAYANNFTSTGGTTGNSMEVYVSGSDFVNLTHNNFIDPTSTYILAVTNGSAVISGEYTDYNWWSDYVARTEGNDSNGDGIGSVPYPITNDVHTLTTAHDNFPLWVPYNWLGWDSSLITYGAPGVNTTYGGYPCLFFVNMTDPVGIAGYYYSHNLTGAWENSSFIVVSDTFAWGNFTGTLPAVGSWVGFRYYANTSEGFWFNSPVYYFQTTDNAEYTLAVIPSGFIYANIPCWLNYTLETGGGMNTSLINEIRIQLSDGIWLVQNPAYNSTALLSDPMGYCSRVEGYDDSYVVIINGTHLQGFINLTMSMNHPPQYIYAVAYSMATDYGTDNASLAPWQYWATFSYVGAEVNASYVMYYVTENVNIPQFTSPSTISIDVTTSYTSPTDVGVMGGMIARMYSSAGSWGYYALVALPVLLMLLAGRHNAAVVGMISAALCLFVNIAAGVEVYSITVLGIIAFVCLLALFYDRGKV